MPSYRYTALDARGRQVKGNLEGNDSRAVASALRNQSLFVVAVEDAARAAGGGAGLNADVSTWFAPAAEALANARGVSLRDRIFFFQQMGLMLRTGLTLTQALEVTREQAAKPRWAKAIGKLIDDIQSGGSLSTAMARQPQYFPTLAIKLVETAEASGELDQMLDQTAIHLERAADMRRKLLTSLTYPTIVVITSIAVATFLVVKVIPKFAAFFARRQVALPWSTQFLVDLSDYVQAYGLWVAGGFAAIVATVVVTYLMPRGRRLIDRLLLSLPIVGSLLITGAVAQVSQVLALLLASGVTLLDSLRIAAKVLPNRALSAIVEEAADGVLRGHDLAGSFRNPLVPKLMNQVVAVGERTGALSQVLEELSAFYDKLMQARIQRMSAMIEPVMILVIGGMVGFVYFSFFQAVFQLATAGR